MLYYKTLIMEVINHFELEDIYFRLTGKFSNTIYMRVYILITNTIVYILFTMRTCFI